MSAGVESVRKRLLVKVISGASPDVVVESILQDFHVTPRKQEGREFEGLVRVKCNYEGYDGERCKYRGSDGYCTSEEVEMGVGMEGNACCQEEEVGESELEEVHDES